VLEQATSTFEIYPAIDLRAGRVVRLRQGDFAREQVYDDDPVGVAAGFVAQGARWIHVVDLDGAVAGDRRQSSVIGAIVDACAASTTAGSSAEPGARVQVAGGLRDADAIADALSAGAARVVLGTVAITAPDIVAAAIEAHGPDRIAVALDIRDGLAVGHGWVPGGPAVPVRPALERLAALGVGTFIVTAIARDGLLGGPDLDLLRDTVSATAAAIVASGGVASLEDLEAIRAIGCRGAVVGRAIYDGRFDVREAIGLSRPGRSPGPSTSR